MTFCSAPSPFFKDQRLWKIASCRSTLALDSVGRFFPSRAQRQENPIPKGVTYKGFPSLTSPPGYCLRLPPARLPLEGGLAPAVGGSGGFCLTPTKVGLFVGHAAEQKAIRYGMKSRRATLKRTEERIILWQKKANNRSTT